MEQITAVHLSDLHIEHGFARPRFSFGISGFKGHDLRLCHGLVSTFSDLAVQLRLAPEERLRVVVSGDLTANGGLDDFAAAHTFLHSHWRLTRTGPSRSAGLMLSEGDVETVPGNHDHWGGSNIRPTGYQPRLIGPHFRPTPWRTIWRSPGGSLELELFGIDSNAGLPTGRMYHLAQGRLSKDELNRLEAMLKISRSDEGVARVRAIVVHHSPSYRGGHLPRPLTPLILDQSSVDRLVGLATRHRIAAILTGHTHDAFWHPFTRVVNGVARSTFELRAPTTLQGPAAAAGAGFLLHQIRLDEERNPYWATWLYEWTFGPRFEPRNPPRPWIQFRAP